MPDKVTSPGKNNAEAPRTPPRAGPPTRPNRPRELQDGLNHYLYHPLAWRLALVLARTPLSPNMVSVIGACFGVAAGIAYAQPGWPAPALIGMALHMSWHVVDGADGDLARITGRASPIGEMVDGACDYLSHTVLYGILGWILAHQIGPWGHPFGPWAWALMLAAAASHAVQANHVEVEKRSYQWWVYGTPWLRHSAKAAPGKDGENGGEEDRKGVLARLGGAYLAVAEATTRGSARVDAAMAAAGSDPAKTGRIRAAARAQATRLMPILKLLGPNPRAPLLGLSMLAGSPLWYFLWVIVGLNLFLVVSIRRHDAAADRIIAAGEG